VDVIAAKLYALAQIAPGELAEHMRICTLRGMIWIPEKPLEASSVRSLSDVIMDYKTARLFQIMCKRVQAPRSFRYP
jgi:hypothetical protein